MSVSGLASCVSLSVRILDLLLASKNNKHEFRSLKSAVDNTRVFLTAVPQEGITQQGNEVLGEQQQWMPIDLMPSGAFSGCHHAPCMVLWGAPSPIAPPPPMGTHRAPTQHLVPACVCSNHLQNNFMHSCCKFTTC
jgi:hypothetical protein